MQAVPPEELSAHWEYIERGLLEIIRLTGEEWTPAHVKQHLWEGWAQLFVCEDGFAVLQRLKSEWTSEPYLNVWAMWFKPGAAKVRRGELVAWIKAEAARKGCARWRFTSPRRGWGALEGEECEIERITWRSR